MIPRPRLGRPHHCLNLRSVYRNPQQPGHPGRRPTQGGGAPIVRGSAARYASENGG